MTPRTSETPGAFGTPLFEVRWERRGLNFRESLHAAFFGPSAAPGFDPAHSFFRLRVAPGRARRWQVAGSAVCHVLMLIVALAISRIPAPKARISLPQIQITWFGQVTDVAPVVAPKPPKPKERAPEPKPKFAPQPHILARAYNPKITVIFRPPRPSNTRQVLIEPDAPPQMPRVLPGLPNIITWAAQAPVRPQFEVNARALLARQRSAEAAMRAPRIVYATPPKGPLDVAADPSAKILPPLEVQPSAVHVVRSPSRRIAEAPEPSIGGVAPGTQASQLTSAANPEIAPPAVDASAIRAAHNRRETQNIAAPQVAMQAQRLVALSLAPGHAIPPPGNASAPISIGPTVRHVASAAAPNLSASGAPGASGAGAAAAAGPAGLFIENESRIPAPPPKPSVAPRPAKITALPKIARVAPASPREVARARPAILPNRAEKQTLAQRVLGPWRVHTLLMNMPNLTSATGSWVLNFVQPLYQKMQKNNDLIAPLPVHSVDPEYPPAEIEAGEEGEVVLFAVIGTDGRVSRIRVVQGLDPVLDKNAETAFSQWRFEPALRNNQPVKLRVLVHVPFYYSKPH
jgi:TonB family protein